MFITLRTSGSQNKAGGMEQVVQRIAGPRGVRDRARPTRRPACVACQTKKRRCTGNALSCERCQTRLIECVFPPSTGHDNPRSYPPQPSSSSRLAWQKTGDASPQQDEPPSRDSISGDGAGGPNSGSSKPPQQAGMTARKTPNGGDRPDGDFFDLDVIDGLDIDMDELDWESTPVDARLNMSSINSGSSDTYRPNKSPRDAYDPNYPVPQERPQTAPNTIAQEMPSVLAVGTAPLSPAQSWAPAGAPPPPDLNRTSSPLCSCLSDLVRVVQQLDDDEFHITTMSLDQVLQLQKWLVFQCCKPLDCSQCLDLAPIHTVRLILCDRLTEMFECIHLRIKRAGTLLAGQSSSSSSSTQSTVSQSPDSHYAPSHHSLPPVPQQPPAAAVNSRPSPAQLFCGSSGCAANAAPCNPLMFSDDFRNQYSDEEQVHMIRALLKLQIKNFQKLLLRIECTSQVVAGQARQSKVKSMMVRLSKAATDIEGALGVVLQAFVVVH